VAARNVPDGVDADQDCQAEREGDAEIPDTEGVGVGVWEVGGEDCGCHTAENQEERAEGFSGESGGESPIVGCHGDLPIEVEYCSAIRVLRVSPILLKKGSLLEENARRAHLRADWFDPARPVR
jgi:hypothetical protein